MKDHSKSAQKFRAWLGAAAVVLCVSLMAGQSAASTVMVPMFSFEAGSGENWVQTMHKPGGAAVTGGYHGWSSDGSRSYQLGRGTGTVSSGRWVQIQMKNVDFTGVTKIIFDAQDRGIDAHRLEFWVGNDNQGYYRNNGGDPQMTGSAWGRTATHYDIEIPLIQAYAGVHDFTITFNDHANISAVTPTTQWTSSGGTYWPADGKYYRIDNIRFEVDQSAVVPAPLALMMGLPLLLMMKIRSK